MTPNDPQHLPYESDPRMNQPTQQMFSFPGVTPPSAPAAAAVKAAAPAAPAAPAAVATPAAVAKPAAVATPAPAAAADTADKASDK